MKIAALIKQVPKFQDMELGADGRLRREGLELDMNPYCRRAVSKGVELARELGGTCTVISLGPPTAEDSLREAVAWGADEAVLVTDPAFAGSDTLATARALVAVLKREGPFDLILTGKNSVDADTGQVGPEIAELMDLPFATGARHLSVTPDGIVDVRCEHDDGSLHLRLHLPAVVSTAERLCEPAKVDPDGRAAVPAARIRRLTAADLGPGPWGQAGSPTTVGQTRRIEIARQRVVLAAAPAAEQARAAIALLRKHGALDSNAGEHAATKSIPDAAPGAVPESAPTIDGPIITVVVEPDRDTLTRELLGTAAVLAAKVSGAVVAFTITEPDLETLGSLGADSVVYAADLQIEEDVASALTLWSQVENPWAILAPSTAWGREVASRTAARLSAGLSGDAIALDVDGGRMVAWKPAFGGQLVAAILASSAVQMATVRIGVLPRLTPRRARTIPITGIPVLPRGRVEFVARTRDDDLDTLAEANAVVGVGRGVAPEEYGELDSLLAALGAELAATRKVTDNGWLPRARQIGITGRSIAPNLYVSIGASGKFNHSCGFASAAHVLAINNDPDAPIFEVADVGIVGDWHEIVPALVAELR